MEDVYVYLNNLVNAHRGSVESFPNYEMHFNALVSKFNSHASSISFSESITGLTLTNSADIDDNHPVSILAAAAEDLLTT